MTVLFQLDQGILKNDFNMRDVLMYLFLAVIRYYNPHMSAKNFDS